MFYQRACCKCFHVAVIYKFVAAKDFASALETCENSWTNNSSDVIEVGADSLFMNKHATKLVFWMTPVY